MNTVLITSIGKRVQLIKHLKKNFKVIGADAGELISARYFVDKFYQISKAGEKNYIDDILKICKKEKVEILIPLYEGEFDILNENRKIIEKYGVKLCLSSKNVIDVCNNKEKTNEFFNRTEINIPKVYSKCEIENIIKENNDSVMPLFIKPIDGMGSINAFKINNIKELKFFNEYIKNGIIQQYIDGEEYTVDCLVNFEGKAVYIIPRKRIEVRSGEVVKSQSVNDKLLISEAKKVINKLNSLKDNNKIAAVGPLTIQFFKTKEQKIFLLEINPRFGGGVPLSFECGADYGKALSEMLKGNNYIVNNCFKEKLMLRYDEAVFVNTGHTEEICNNKKLYIFDLDDTLYYEKEFVLGAFMHVCEYLGEKYKVDSQLLFYRMIEILNTEGRGNIFDVICSEYGFEEKIEKLVDIYRSANPKLKLYEDSEAFINRLKEKGISIGIITDGCSKVQWNKIKSLGLESKVDKIIVTDDYGDGFEKPNQRSYTDMIKYFNVKPYECVYIGDNPKKDFVGAKALNINTIRIKRDRGDHINDIVSFDYEADLIINNFYELTI